MISAQSVWAREGGKGKSENFNQSYGFATIHSNFEPMLYA